MAKQKRTHQMTAARWLERSRLPEIRKAIEADPYIKAWGPITRHLAKSAPLTWDDVIIALHLAYSWMPTIPDLGQSYALTTNEQALIVESLNRVRNGGTIPDEDELLLLKRFSNNSIIGASKLLHFLAPNRCPIWDKRVADSFYWTGISDANQIPRYLTYRKALADWLTDDLIMTRVREMKREIPVLADAPPLRVLELVLFENSPANTALAKDTHDKG